VSSLVDPEEFRAALHRVADWVADYREGLGDRPVRRPSLRPGELNEALPEAAPATSEPLDDVLSDLDRLVVPGLVHWQHPSFFGYFPSNASPASVLAELVAAGLGVNAFSWESSPAATELEQVVVEWMAEALGLPDRLRWASGGGGVIQDSASSATLSVIVAAREHALAQGAERGRLVAYTSAEAHSSVAKGMRVAGFKAESLRLVPTDDAWAMDPRRLRDLVEADLAAGLHPFCVIATSGTTTSMAMDPLRAIVEVGEAHGLWVHVDAAMAGIAALCPELRWVLDGIERVDSWSTNPHKWMGAQLDCTLLFVADRARLVDALEIEPAYLRRRSADGGVEVPDFRNWQVPLGRRFRALKLFFVLRLEGLPAIQAMIRRHVELAAELAEQVASSQNLELAAPPRLGLVCLRHRAGPKATEALARKANESGRALFTQSVLGKEPILRVSIGSLSTERKHVLSALELLEEVATEVVG